MKSNRLIVFVIFFLLAGAGLVVVLKTHAFSPFSFTKQKTVEKPWVFYTDPQQLYTAFFPVKPQKQQETIPLGPTNFPSNWVTMSAHSNADTYRVDTIVVPDEYIVPLDIPKTLTENAKLMITIIVPTAASNPSNPHEITYNGYPALRYDIKDDDTKTVYHMITFNVASQVYSVGVSSTMGLFVDQEKFFSSFKLDK